jgi:hypothetical protein
VRIASRNRLEIGEIRLTSSTSWVDNNDNRDLENEVGRGMPDGMRTYPFIVQ